MNPATSLLISRRQFLSGAAGVVLSTNRWRNAGTMRSPRDAHVCLQMPDGRLLLAGGRISARGQTTARVEWFDPRTDTGGACGRLGGSRSFVPATEVGGAITLAGGFRQGFSGDDRTVTDGDILDLESLTWRAASPLLHPRELHSATAVGECALVAGGFSNGRILSSSELLLPGGIRVVGQLLNTPRFGHLAVAIGHDSVMLIGGRTTGDKSVREAELIKAGELVQSALYKLDSGTLPGTARHTDRSASVTGGGVPKADDEYWSRGPLLNAGRFRATATTLKDGRILIAGGYSSDAGETLRSAEIFHPSERRFQLLDGLMADGRMDHTATLLDDGRVLITGGWCSQRQETVASAELWDPGTLTFRTTEPMPYGRHEHCAIRIGDGRVVVSGGLYATPSAARTLDDILIFTPPARLHR